VTLLSGKRLISLRVRTLVLPLAENDAFSVLHVFLRAQYEYFPIVPVTCSYFLIVLLYLNERKVAILNSECEVTL